VALNIYGLTLALLFFAFSAPDVALSELAVGGVVLPMIVLLALARVRSHER
jgi:energy-converting hydrogenase B subunit D